MIKTVKKFVSSGISTMSYSSVSCHHPGKLLAVRMRGGRA